MVLVSLPDRKSTLRGKEISKSGHFLDQLKAEILFTFYIGTYTYIKLCQNQSKICDQL